MSRLDSHHRLLLGLFAFVLALLLIGGEVTRTTRLLVAWNCFALVELTLAWAVIVRAHPTEVRRTVKLQDSGRRIILMLVVASSCVSLVAVGIELSAARNLAGLSFFTSVALSTITIAFSWTILHTVFALHFAHIYYTAGKAGDGGWAGGLKFPDEEKPDYLDFAYFSFVIGMTWQVSDVSITSRRFRHVVLLHGLLSFAFNTIILALAVSIISGLM